MRNKQENCSHVWCQNGAQPGYEKIYCSRCGIDSEDLPFARIIGNPKDPRKPEKK